MAAGDPLGRRPVYRKLTGGDPLGRGRAVVSRKTEEARFRTSTAGPVVQPARPCRAVGRGQQAYVKDDRVVRIEGDPDSPVSMGSWLLCGGPCRPAHARGLTETGAAAPSLLGHRSRPVAAGAGLARHAGSARTHLGVLAAGTASAEDPAHTVVPRREAVGRRTAPSK